MYEAKNITLHCLSLEKGFYFTKLSMDGEGINETILLIPYSYLNSKLSCVAATPFLPLFFSCEKQIPAL